MTDHGARALARFADDCVEDEFERRSRIAFRFHPHRRESGGAIATTDRHELRRVEVRPEPSPRDAAQALEPEDPTRRTAAGLTPLRNRALSNAKTPSDIALSPGPLYRLLNHIAPHEFELITEIDGVDNTASVSLNWHDDLAMQKVEAGTTFWDRLQEAAAANGIEPTQSAIARDLGIRQSAVAKWTTDGRPKITRLEQIASKYQFNVEYLLRGTGLKRPQGVGEPDDTRELLAHWRSLPAAARKSVLDQVRVIRSLVAPLPLRKTEKAR